MYPDIFIADSWLMLMCAGAMVMKEVQNLERLYDEGRIMKEHFDLTLTEW